MAINPRIDKLAQVIFKQPNLQACTEKDIANYVNQYPFSNAAQLLLLKKMQLSGDANYESQLKITQRFFPNSAWLNFLLSDSAPALVEEITYEPYHTIDYFASQGIKIREEANPTDKFGQQLKSFTDWLKVMKRLPVKDLSKHIETKDEKKVEQMAGASLADREVVTESMAEVWEKQGNIARAIEVYKKLSLLEPSKSAYFASKIDQLNKTK